MFDAATCRPATQRLLYERMLRILHRRGYEKPTWFTPMEFARALPNTEFATTVHDLTHAYNEVRFGGSREAAARMVNLLDLLERQSS